MFEYISAHIRRNDFQFKNSWMDPQTSFDNIHNSIKDIEKEKNIKISKIYVSSDAEPNFYANVTSNLKVYRWPDFFDSKNGILKNINVPRKLEGLVEMIISAAGYRFSFCFVFFSLFFCFGISFVLKYCNIC